MMEYEFDLVVTHAINVVGGSGGGAALSAARMVNVVGGSGAVGELRDFGGLGPASLEASASEGAAPLPPRT